MKKNNILILSLLFTLSSCGQQPTAEPTVEPTVEPTAEPTVEPTIEPTIEPTEFIVSDEKLTNSTFINDNYRVFYEIFTGSFSDSNGDGIGDLQGIINRMDYLNDGDLNSGKSLGIQGLWLTPIFESPTYHKYDVTDYYKIDPKFGDMNDLVALIEKCHERDVKLIIDLPINHTGNKNQWFLNFQNAHKNNDPSDPYYDFYCYYRSGDPIPAGRSFSMLYGTDIFYECNFSGNMPELNFDNETVRNEVLEIAKYYLNLGIDGFRFDAAKYIYYGDHEKSSDFWGWFMNELKTIKPDIFTVGEVWDSDLIGNQYIEKGLDCFNFSMSGAEGKIASAAKKGNVNVYTKYIENYIKSLKKINENAIMMPFIANHDMDRAAGYVNMLTNQAYMAANLYLLSSGTPFIYYGEEIGLKGSRGSASSDANRRLAMLWGDEDTIKDPSEATFKSKYQVNGTVASQITEESSLLNHYKKLIMIRNAYPEISRGEYKALSTSIEYVGGFVSTYNDSSVCVIHNVGSTSYEIDLTSLTTTEFKNLEVVIGLDSASYENGKLIIGSQTSVVLK